MNPSDSAIAATAAPPPALTSATTPQCHALAERVRAVLQLDHDTTVTIAQQKCLDAGCPEVKTTITLISPSGASRRLRILSPLGVITPLLLTEALKREGWLG